ncbi:2OG-Fe(II) oxygenase [Acidiphilium sp.]|uniref:2OG-Fe(II) oxygenase n=1 Tax=Acidiphilium sp. TaxID=527 RepID=UPI003CFCFD62
MVSITKDLAAVMGLIQRCGDFFAHGIHEIAAPGLDVVGIGPIALPLLPSQAAQLIGMAERAPYGRGEQTLVDVAVRRSWQLNPDRVRIRGSGWARTLDAIVARAAEGLGVTGKVTAEFYKLLVYDEGSFFVNHRDSEKIPGMFATLIIELPSIHTGGDLIIRHAGREARIESHLNEPSEAAFAAFYADCVHEVLPVTSGCRLTLVYNLSRCGRGTQPVPPIYTAEQARICGLLGDWSEQKKRPEEASPEKVIYLLEHSYTPENLSFAALKGADAARASTLLAAAGRTQCDLHLALLSIEESGTAEYTGDYRRRYRHSDDDNNDDFEAGEVYEREERLLHWRHPASIEAAVGELPISEDEISPPGALADLAPDEENFREATGNEGASFERSYRRAALVLWPSHRRLAVLNQGGLQATLPYLTQLTQAWAKAGEDPESPIRAEAHELTGYMLADWPREIRHARNVPKAGATVLELLGRLGDIARTDDFLSAIFAGGLFDLSDNEQIAQSLRRLPSSRAAELLERLVANSTSAAIGAGLLACTVSAALGEFEMRPAAFALMATLPGDSTRKVELPSWQQPPPVEPQLVIDALTALCQIDAALAERAAGVFLSRPATYGADSVLVPASLALIHSVIAQAPAVARLRSACVAHLRIRIAEPLAPPTDWARDSKLSCSCRYCVELSRFLADPEAKTWNFKAAQHDRSHVESTIRENDCDVLTATIRRGSPHILECTKNQASYKRRTRQRQKDLADLARLEEDQG